MNVKLTYFPDLNDHSKAKIIKARIGTIRKIRADEQIKKMEIQKLANKIRGVLTGAIGITKSVSGIGVACPNEIASRLAICENCEIREGKKCGDCGCYIEHKTRLANEECPKGYWGPVPICEKR